MSARLRTRIALRVALCAAALLLVSLAGPLVARAGSIFAVSGRGWGHGIGMTQYGAKGYAEQGWDYRRILAWYFQRTTIATRVQLTVKVDLDDGRDARSSWLIAAASNATTLTVSELANGAHALEVTRGAAVWVSFSNGTTRIRADRYNASAGTHTAGSTVETFPAAVVAATGSTTASKVRILGTSGPFAQSNIAWRGQIRFTPSGDKGHAIDYVPMEQYLRGVVPRESPSSWPVQALRAQAVAARSYAYGAASSGDVLWCTTMSQVYNGADDGPNTHESAKTDAAVADTANEFVVYGSGVIKTFFSSSSGGRTANSKDVWFSSRDDDTSPVYYTSVVDADSASPNYRWKLPDMTGATLAGKIRSHYASLSRVSPATVVKVTLDPGSSGFVRYVTLDWSKGADTVLTGPQFQHALGLKSSAFTVKLKNPPPVATALTLRSNVSTVTAGVRFTLSGELTPHRVATVTLQHRFPGTSAWISFRTLKTASDGTFSASTLTKAVGRSQYRAVCAASTGWLASTSPTVGLDVRTPPVVVPPVWKRFQQTTSAAVYSGAWKSSALAGLSGGTHKFSHETSASVVFTFTGTRVRWIGKRAANYGKAWVSVDGSSPVLIDLYSATTRNQLRLFESAILPLGTHRLKIRVAGTKNAKATYHYADVDAFEALRPAD